VSPLPLPPTCPPPLVARSARVPISLPHTPASRVAPGTTTKVEPSARTTRGGGEERGARTEQQRKKRGSGRGRRVRVEGEEKEKKASKAQTEIEKQQKKGREGKKGWWEGKQRRKWKRTCWAGGRSSSDKEGAREKGTGVLERRGASESEGRGGVMGGARCEHMGAEARRLEAEKKDIDWSRRAQTNQLLPPARTAPTRQHHGTTTPHPPPPSPFVLAATHHHPRGTPVASLLCNLDCRR